MNAILSLYSVVTWPHEPSNQGESCSCITFERFTLRTRGIRQRTLQRTGQVDVEERPVDALHHGHLAPILIRLAGLQIFLELVILRAVAVLVRRLLDAMRLDLRRVRRGLDAVFDVAMPVPGLVRVLRFLVVHNLRVRGRRGTAFDLCHAEDGLPPVEAGV